MCRSHKERVYTEQIYQTAVGTVICVDDLFHLAAINVHFVCLQMNWRTANKTKQANILPEFRSPLFTVNVIILSVLVCIKYFMARPHFHILNGGNDIGFD